jgi:hypothetical protein
MDVISPSRRRLMFGQSGYAPLRLTFNLRLSDLGGTSGVDLAAQGLGLVTPTFTRNSVAWFKTAGGVWAKVASNVPRSHYLSSPSENTSAAGSIYAGYWQEGAGINLVTPAAAIRDMTNAAWVKTGLTAVKNAQGIDGLALSASTLTASAPAATVLQILTAAASSRIYSVFLRRKTGSGAILIQQGATTLDVTAQLNTLTYTRVFLLASVLNSAFGIRIATTGDAVEADFNQFEPPNATKLIGPSSPIETQAPREADALSFTIAGNADFAQGSVYAEIASIGWNSGLGSIVSLGDGGIQTNISPNSLQIADRVNFNSVAFTPSSITVRKVAANWGGATAQAFANGVAGVAGTFSGALGTGNSIYIGTDPNPSNHWYGTIKNVQITLVKPTEAQMLARVS